MLWNFTLFLLVLVGLMGPSADALGQIQSSTSKVPHHRGDRRAIADIKLRQRQLPEDLDDAILAAISSGITWLVDNQQGDGYWSGGAYTTAATALAVLKLETYAIEQDLDPLGADYEYSTQVAKGLKYILDDVREDAGGRKYCADQWNSHQIYLSSLCLMAIAASDNPEKVYPDPSGDKYYDIAESIAEYIALSQSDCPGHPDDGGWHYPYSACDSDNSNSGWATLALGYAEASPPWGFGIEIAETVKDPLNAWIDRIQCDAVASANYGGSKYKPDQTCSGALGDGWVNMLKTGNLLYEMALVGDDVFSTRVQDAIEWIELNWNAPGGSSAPNFPGWLNHRQAMFTLMKGLTSLNIELLDVNDDGIAETNWYEEIAQHLIDTQNLDGSWPLDPWTIGLGDPAVFSTAWALLTLEHAVPEIADPLALEKHDNVAECAPLGSSISYKICYENDNAVDIESVELVDSLPSDVTFVLAPEGTYNSEEHSVTWDIGTIEPDDDDCMELGVSVKSDSTPDTLMTNQATISFPVGGISIKTDTYKETLICPNTPPDCTGASASPDKLWPPNHKFRNIDIAGVTDVDDDAITITITRITQDEPVNGPGDGNTAPDGKGVGSPPPFQLRAERTGTQKNGRVYTVGFKASDGQATCTGTVQVCVPHDKKDSCKHDGRDYDSTATRRLLRKEA